MSMVTPPPTERRIVTTAREGIVRTVREAGAGAAVIIVAVVAINLLIHLAIAAAITIAAVLVIGGILWMAFFRKRQPGRWN